MKINSLKINGFGKLKNIEIDFKDNINIIYGKNETGKTTLQKFIISMLFGISKNKNQKSISDFDKYYPWNSLMFSGKINYELDNKEEFEIFRDFLKKNPIIYNKKIDITGNFKIDKNKGITFFEEQTGIDEKTFLDTTIIEQQNVKLSRSSQNNIVQKITNLMFSGDENISYQKTFEKIIKMQTEKIGNTRTTQRPINVIENELINLEKEKFKFTDLKYENQEIIKELEKQNLELQNNIYKLDLLKETKEYIEESKIKVAEIDFNKQLEKEYDEKILNLKNKIDIRAKQNIKIQKINYKFQYISFVFLVIMIFLVQMCFKNIYATTSFGVFSSVLLGYSIWVNIKKNKKVREKLNQIEELQEKINKEIEVLKTEKDNKSFQTKIKNEKLYIDIQKNEERLTKKYSDKIENCYIQNVFSLEISEIILKIKELEQIIESNKIKIYALNQEKIKIEEEILKYDNTNAEINNLQIEKDKLISLNNSFELAKKALEEAYKEMKEKISPELISNLCKMAKKISNGKYTNINFDDENGLCVEVENGQYIAVDKLSVGTIDQLYLSLRILGIEGITIENMPIILDETFAYFDDDRIKNILEYINNEYSKNQVIIFTCSNREIEALESIGIKDYNLIVLE